MRTDESGHPCPETLGEYRELCAAMTTEDNPAVKFLDEKIKAQGEDQKVVATDAEMRAILIPLMVKGGLAQATPERVERAENLLKNGQKAEAED